MSERRLFWLSPPLSHNLYGSTLRGVGHFVWSAEMSFTFIDLFAGIGGFRIGFESAGGKCVFSSEYDKFAAKTYKHNHGDTPFGDIREVQTSDIPDFDILCAGFPCQPFSGAGQSTNKFHGNLNGFGHITGTAFFEVARIIRDKKPKAFVLENVPNLKTHDKGRTYSIIMDVLSELGYSVKSSVVDGEKWVPQKRKRLFIVGFLGDGMISLFQHSRMVILPESSSAP